MTDKTEAMDNLIAQDADLIEIRPDDLVRRLRVGDYYPDGDIGYHEISPGKVDALCEQAADRIEAQAAEIERLRHDLERHVDEVEDQAYELGKRDGYESAVQDIDMLTGGDGEYCYSTVGGERHCPDPDSMKARIADRIEAQAAEIERLNKSAECLAETRRLAVKDVAELEAEIERLHRALRDVIECDPGAYEATIARAALEATHINLQKTQINAQTDALKIAREALLAELETPSEELVHIALAAWREHLRFHTTGDENGEPIFKSTSHEAMTAALQAVAAHLKEQGK